jgi:hypothetical protein
LRNKVLSKKNILILLYPLVFFLLVTGIAHFSFPGIFSRENFLNWDAEHYFWIKNKGYEGFRVAFFPLFPLIWKTLHLNVYGIVVFNTLVFLSAFYVLTDKLKSDLKQTVLYLSIPSFCFFFLPYTEALFFAGSSILLTGLMNNKIPVVYLGLFLCTLTRPAFTVFIPALIITELITYKLNTATAMRILSYIAVTVAGMIVVGALQYKDTGKWFEFFEAQKGWGNELQAPKFPLNSWGGGMILRVDGACLLMGLVAGIIVLAKWFKLEFIKNMTFPKEVIFSLCYLSGISLTVLLFRGGFLFSLNRFFLATPFIIVAVNFFLKQPVKFTTRFLVIAFICIFAFWLLLGSYLHITALLLFLALTAYIFLFFFIKSEKKAIQNLAISAMIVLNITFQVIFFLKFLNKEWVG